MNNKCNGNGRSCRGEILGDRLRKWKTRMRIDWITIQGWQDEDGIEVEIGYTDILIFTRRSGAASNHGWIKCRSHFLSPQKNKDISKTEQLDANLKLSHLGKCQFLFASI